MSGLIVLGERPIRVGDVVTVGDITGTVTSIRARATVVTDFENKEVMIPNKAFITERVINWTLSNQTTRLLITLGLAYGTDVERAQRLMLAAVESNADVLRDPAPSVFFVGFGDSALNFEIRAFVDTLRETPAGQARHPGCGRARARRSRHRDSLPAARPAHPLGGRPRALPIQARCEPDLKNCQRAGRSCTMTSVGFRFLAGPLQTAVWIGPRSRRRRREATRPALKLARNLPLILARARAQWLRHREQSGLATWQPSFT